MTGIQRTSLPEGHRVSRRDFLRVGGLSVVGLSVAEQAEAGQPGKGAGSRSCIFLLMTGGPSQLETFDPKPSAPSEVRGPLKPIATATPGLHLSESFPRLAERSNRFALLRTLHHEAAPIHETGFQLVQTGRLARHGVRHPAFGSVIARLLGPRDGIAPYVVLPRLLGQTGVNAYRGQEAGYLGADYQPISDPPADQKRQAADEPAAGGSGAPPHPSASEQGDGSFETSFLPAGFLEEESSAVRRAYGDSRFGRLCLAARKLVECGVRCVTVNMFDSLAGQLTWDCHGRRTAEQGDLFDYRDTLGPQFDCALAALLDDLAERGLLEETLVVAVGEFGRTPRINEYGGRDHWPGCWSALIAGAGVEGGRAIGTSDAIASSPADRPIAPEELLATIYDRLGLNPETPLALQDGTTVPIADRPAIAELLG